MINLAFLSLGTNIEPEKNLVAATQMLGDMTELVATSSAWESEAINANNRPADNQPNYLNSAALVKTSLTPAQLKRKIIQQIEQNLGRARQADKFAPRTIDIDIMLFNEQILRLGNRRIPDPEVLQRPFVAIPLAEIAPDYQHPETGQTLREIAQQFAAKSGRMRYRADVSDALTKLTQAQPGKVPA